MAGTSINVARLEKLLGMMVVRADKAGQLVGIPLREVRRAFARKGEREAPLRTWYAFQRWVKKEGWCVFTRKGVVYLSIDALDQKAEVVRHMLQARGVVETTQAIARSQSKPDLTPGLRHESSGLVKAARRELTSVESEIRALLP